MPEGSTNFVMHRISDLFRESGMSLDAFGQAMGYEGDVARKAAWQFLNKTSDPRLSMLEKAADALHVTVADLVADPKRKSKK